MSSKWLRARSIAVALTIVTGAAFAPVGPVGADHTGEEAERAAREILEARDRANAAAQAMFDAESHLDSLTVELAAAERDLAALESEVGQLRADLTDTAIRNYVGAGPDPLTMFQDVGRNNDRAAAIVYTGAATGGELIRVDDYDEAIDRLDAARRDLERQRTDTTDARDDWAALKADAEREVLELQQIEEERLAHAQVQHELERQRQARAEQEAREQAARDQEAREQAARQDERQRAAAAPSGAASNGSGAASNDSDADTAPPVAPTPVADETPAPADDSDDRDPPPAPTTPPPAPAPEPDPEPAPASNAGAGMACPVAGPRSFADTWGAPRGGGRRHQGVDMMAPGGTPLVAVEAGSVYFKTNRLGGNAVWLTGASGTKYYYAHLSAWEGASRSVSRGEVIGYVGATGNTSVNHLHFEVHPHGGRAVNPYPYVRAAC